MCLKIYMKKIIFLICLVFLSFGDLSAKHIVGGIVTYRCLGINVNNTATFEITVLIYRDLYGQGAEFDDPAEFGLYRGSGSSWSHIQTYNERVQEENTIDIDRSNPCLVVPGNIGVEEGKYVFEITVDISTTDSYQIVYQRCCRNNTINNIITPEDTGAAYSVEISPEAQRECDSSATFDDFPPVVICADQLLEFDHGATDLDGDQISYTFCDPIAAGGIRGINGTGANECDGITPSPANCPPPHPPVTWKVAQGFNTTTPLGNSITINAATGEIRGVPTVPGQYVVGVCATSFRNGVEIGKIFRDFQFNVTPCEVAVHASIAADEILNGPVYVINQCGELNVEIENTSVQENRINTYDWEFYVGADTLTFDSKNVNITLPDTGSYNAMLFLNREEVFDDCKDSARVLINIYPKLTADFSVEYDTCFAGPVEFEDLSHTDAGGPLEWDWDFGDGNTSTIQNPLNVYSDPGGKLVTLMVKDKNNCTDQVQIEFPWFPTPPILIVEPDLFVGCVPASITFNNLSSPIDETYHLEWDFGDGETSDEISPTHLYEEIGKFSVKLFVRSPIGCEIDADFGELITILESPVAGFSFTPENPSNFNRTVTFIDESENAKTWLYDFGGLAKLEREPTYTFPDTGVVEVIQVVTHETTGCTDTAKAFIDIEPLVTLHLPNAFTPNDDGLNDDFRGKGYFDGFRSYNMQIWNRWGEMIFETDNPNLGWNGKKKGSDTLAPAGVYIYSISYDPPRGETKIEKGHVTLIR